MMSVVRMVGAMVGLSVLLAAAWARAEPPPGADGSLAPWFQSLTQPGTGFGCCSIADCRPVRTRYSAGHIDAFIGSDAFRDAPDAWVQVPEAIMIRGRENPLGQPVACWYQRKLVCFVDGGAA